jgi:RimJ/RimL family protein N-acetyltransferase
MTLALAELEHGGAPALAAALGVPAPLAWPPDFYDADDLERMKGLLRDPANAGWALYYLIQRGPPRVLVGVAGYGGRPTAAGVVEIGYAVLPAHRRSRFATEAVAALVAHAFREASVQVVIAETFPHLVGSIGVLERNHFRLGAARGHGGALRYELQRAMLLTGPT